MHDLHTYTAYTHRYIRAILQVSRILTESDREGASNTVRNAAADVAVALALYRSASSGQWEKCERFDA